MVYLSNKNGKQAHRRIGLFESILYGFHPLVLDSILDYSCSLYNCEITIYYWRLIYIRLLRILNKFNKLYLTWYVYGLLVLYWIIYYSCDFWPFWHYSSFLRWNHSLVLLCLRSCELLCVIYDIFQRYRGVSSPWSVQFHCNRWDVWATSRYLYVFRQKNIIM